MSTPPPGPNPYYPPPGPGGGGGAQGQPGPYQGGQPYQGQPHQGGQPYPSQPYQGQPGYAQQPPYPGSGAAPWGAPPPRNNRTAIVLIASLAVVVLVGVVLAVVLPNRSNTASPVTASPSAASSSTAAGSATAAAGSATATAGGAAGAGGPTTTTTAPTAGSVSVDVNVGDCIRLSGSSTDARAEPQTCGSRQANYKVVSKVATQDECPKDADSTYYETKFLNSGERGALCLDVDWVVDDCFEIPQTDDGDPQRVDCTATDPAKDTVKVLKILQNTSNEADCDVFGYTYDERKITVCLDEVRGS